MIQLLHWPPGVLLSCCGGNSLLTGFQHFRGQTVASAFIPVFPRARPASLSTRYLARAVPAGVLQMDDVNDVAKLFVFATVSPFFSPASFRFLLSFFPSF